MTFRREPIPVPIDVLTDADIRLLIDATYGDTPDTLIIHTDKGSYMLIRAHARPASGESMTDAFARARLQAEVDAIASQPCYLVLSLNSNSPLVRAGHPLEMHLA